MLTMSGKALLAPAVLAAAFAAAAAAGEDADPAAAAWERAGNEAHACIQRGDPDSARTRLRAFLARHGESAGAAEARRQLAVIEPIAENQIRTLWDRAEEATRAKTFDSALELYSEIIARRPSADWVGKAKTAIERNDAVTEPLFAAFRKKSEENFASWRFSEAREWAGKAAAELAGTKWADEAARLAAETEAVRALMAGFSARVAASRDQPKKTPFRLKDPSGWLSAGVILAADAQKLSVEVNGAGQELPWKDMSPERMLEIMALYGEPSAADSLALGVLFLRQGRKEAAAARFMAARADSGLFDRAERYLQLIAGKLNVAGYDFSRGLQMLDWEARGGSWRIVKGELVQEAAEGPAELVLGRTTPAARVRFFFEMTVPDAKGLVSATFHQDDANFFGFAFSGEDGYSAFATIKGKTRTVRDAKFKLPAGRRVLIRCGLKDNTFALSVGQTKLPRLEVPGLSALEVRIVLRALDARAAFDNLEISNRAE